MKIEWSDFAQSELYKTIDYIDENFGAESRRKFINEVRHINTLLKTQPI